MSITRERILFSAYNQIISRGYQELSSRFINHVLHLTKPHTDKRRGTKKLKFRLKIFFNILFPLSFPPLHFPTSHIRPTPKLNIETKHQTSNSKIPKVAIRKSF